MEFTRELSASCRVSWVASNGVTAELLLLRMRENRNSVKYPAISWEEPRGAWEKTSRVAALTLKQKALSFREKMIQKYKQWGVGDEQMPVLSALTLGYKGDLDKDIKDAYSVAGISHVLALSGMHIGILWLLLDFLLKPLVVLRLGWLRSLLITGILWGFAFVAQKVGAEAHGHYLNRVSDYLLRIGI